MPEGGLPTGGERGAACAVARWAREEATAEVGEAGREHSEEVGEEPERREGIEEWLEEVEDGGVGRRLKAFWESEEGGVVNGGPTAGETRGEKRTSGPSGQPCRTPVASEGWAEAAGSVRTWAAVAATTAVAGAARAAAAGGSARATTEGAAEGTGGEAGVLMGEGDGERRDVASEGEDATGARGRAEGGEAGGGQWA